MILGKTIGFFTDGIPNFFSKTIPDVFVNKIGGGVVDVTKDVGDFFKDKVGGGIIDVGKLIGNGMEYDYKYLSSIAPKLVGPIVCSCLQVIQKV